MPNRSRKKCQKERKHIVTSLLRYVNLLKSRYPIMDWRQKHEIKLEEMLQIKVPFFDAHLMADQIDF